MTFAPISASHNTSICSPCASSAMQDNRRVVRPGSGSSTASTSQGRPRTSTNWPCWTCIFERHRTSGTASDYRLTGYGASQICFAFRLASGRRRAAAFGDCAQDQRWRVRARKRFTVLCRRPERARAPSHGLSHRLSTAPKRLRPRCPAAGCLKNTPVALRKAKGAARVRPAGAPTPGRDHVGNRWAASSRNDGQLRERTTPLLRKGRKPGSKQFTAADFVLRTSGAWQRTWSRSRQSSLTAILVEHLQSLCSFQKILHSSEAALGSQQK